MKLLYNKVHGFEVNIIPDSECENDFYTIKTDLRQPAGMNELADVVQEFLDKYVVYELADTNFNLHPEAIIIVKSVIIYSADGHIHVKCTDIPYLKIVVDEKANLSVTSLLEES